MWTQYHNVASVNEALQILSDWGDTARLIAGGTDLILELERGIHPGVNVLVDISRIPDLDHIWLDDEKKVHLGPLVTHNHCVASDLLASYAFPLVQACWKVGAPQIRNRGTVAGNLLTASPANDTIPPLVALDATVVLRSVRGERVVRLREFYKGVRSTVIQPDEMLVDIHFPAMTVNQRAVFVKSGLRRAQAISLVNAAIVLTLDDASTEGVIHVENAVIALGSVAPTIVRASQAEAYLVGRNLDNETIAQGAELALQAIYPIDDLRSSAEYRQAMARICIARGLNDIFHGGERRQFPDQPPLLSGDRAVKMPLRLQSAVSPQEPIRTRINGREYVFNTGHDKTLLHLLREEAGLTGTKEGCGEGECGACTIFMDGKAVMACLIPAPRAHGAEIVTIEGISLGTGGQTRILHPVQQAFIDMGAVQCGYCTPGFVMSAVKLLEEFSQPSREQIKQAIAGNLCRCTGYYSIVNAIEQAALLRSVDNISSG